MEDKVLESVISEINYTFEKDVLVKPLEAVMVKKEVTEPELTGEKDEEGNDLYEQKTKVKEVESDFAKGIVLAIPISYNVMADELKTLKLGDTVVYNKRFAKDFDLYRDSQLVKSYDIVAIAK